MVLEVLADPRHVRDHLDAEPAEIVGVADAGQLEELRGVDRPAAQEDLAGVDLTVQATAASVVDPHRTGCPGSGCR